MEGFVMDWETAEKVQKNEAGQFRAMIGGEWVPVEKAQKNESGQYRIMRGETKTPELSKEWREKTMISLARGENPILAKAADIAGGITSTVRGGLNLAGGLFGVGKEDKSESLGEK